MFRKLNDLSIGIAYYSFGTLMLVLLVTVFKKILITYNIDIEQAIFMRQSIIVIGLIPAMYKIKFNFFDKVAFMPNLYRNILFFISTTLLYRGLKLIPLNDGTIIQFIVPIVASVLSVYLLKEKVSRKTWIGLGLAFCGVLIVKMPSSTSSHHLNIGYLFLLATSLIRSYIVILNKKLSGRFSVLQLASYTNIVMLILSGLYFKKFVPVPLSIIPWIILSGIGFFVEYYCVYSAYKRCPASMLQPLDFLKLIFTIISSYLILGEKLSLNQVIGGSVVLFSYLYTMDLKKILGKKR